MANCYDASAGTFEMKRLRTADASYLAGVDRPSTLPEPIAVATGPFISGPVANGTGASDFWVCGAAMPAAGDICWVLVRSDIHIRLSAGITEVESINLFPRGSVTNAAYFEGPQIGPGLAIDALTVASGGTNPLVNVPSQNLYAGRALFLPLDPDWTRLGWDLIAVIQAGAGGGLTQNSQRLDMQGVRLIGYPANVWGTGGLEAVAAFRGS